MNYWTAISIAVAVTMLGCSGATELDPVPVDAGGRLDAGPPPAPDVAGLPDVPDASLADVGDAGDEVVPCTVGLRPTDAGCALAIPSDPEFETPGGWSTFGASEYGDGLEIDRAAACQPGGSGATQLIALGPYDEVGPLRVSVDLRYDLCDNPGLFPCEPGSNLYARVGESTVSIPTPFGLPGPERTVSFCLPSTAYDGANLVSFWAREFDQEACADTDKTSFIEAISAVRFEPVDEATCPTPGAFYNGFEEEFVNAEPFGWDVNTGGTGQVRVGEDEGEQAAAITLTTGCSNAQMRQTVRIPAPSSPDSGTALSFGLDIVDGTPLQVRLGPLQRYILSQPAGDPRICVPSYLWGRSEGLLFRTTGSFDCEEVHDYRAVIDDVTFVDDPACGPAGRLRDGAFAGPLLTGWNASAGGFGRVASTADGVELAIDATCGAATIEQWVTPREAPQALVFDYRATAAGEPRVNLRELGRSDAVIRPLLPATDWTEARVCLSREARMPVNVSFLNDLVDPTCGTGSDASLELREARLEVDPSCGT